MKELKAKYQHARDKEFYMTVNEEYPVHLILGDSTYCNKSMFVKETSDYEKVYSLDVLGVEDRGEDDQLQVYSDFKENVTRRDNGRYEVSVPWISGSELYNTNEQQSRKRIAGVGRKLRRNPKMKEE